MQHSIMRKAKHICIFFKFTKFIMNTEEWVYGSLHSFCMFYKGK